MATLPSQTPITERDHEAARVFVGTTIILLALSLAAVSARLIFKIRSKLLFTLDDYLIVAGAVREHPCPDSRRAHPLTSDRASELQRGP